MKFSTAFTLALAPIVAMVAADDFKCDVKDVSIPVREQQNKGNSSAVVASSPLRRSYPHSFDERKEASSS